MTVSLSGWVAIHFGSKRKHMIGVLLVLIASLKIIPIGSVHLSLAAILAGALGEISSFSVLLVMANFFSRGLPLQDRKLLLLPVMAGLVLYGSVLTYGPFDLYRLGYLHASNGPPGSLLLLGALGLLSLMMPLRLVALISLACLSWSLGLQASTNLWDYLLDVPSVLIYLGLLMRTLLRRTQP